MKANNIFIKANFDLCTGCRMCQMACSFRLHGGYNPNLALLKIREERESLYHFPVVCNQCKNAYCANVCPVKAIDFSPEAGAWIVNHDVCVGCGLCGRYCPIGMAGVDPIFKKSVKCDLCQGDPACVKACPTGALEIGERRPVNDGAEEELTDG